MISCRYCRPNMPVPSVIASRFGLFCFLFDSYGYLQFMMVDVNVQRAESARNANSSGQKVRKRFGFGSTFAFNSSSFKCTVFIYDLTRSFAITTNTHERTSAQT